jgi:formylglycine-generating enzyme required for sulfatase activity
MLARIDPDDPRWAHHADTVVGHLVRMNQVDVDPFAEALKPVRAQLIPLLLKRYPELRQRIESGKLSTSELVAEASAFDLTANLLARYTTDRPAELAEMVTILDPRHYTLFADSIRNNQQAIIPLLKAELRKTAFPTWVGNGEIGVAVSSVAGAPATINILNADFGFDAQAKRQANAAATLFVLGETEPAWSLLAFPNHGDPSVRSYLTQRLATISANPLSLIKRFDAEADVSAKRALLIALGDYPIAAIPVAEREAFAKKLLVLYREHPDSGLHAAIDWLLRQKWNQVDAIHKIDAEFAVAARKAEPARADRNWFVNGEGQTFAVIRGPVEFGMGSPRNEPGRSTFNELAHRAKINRTFAIATKEVTAGEFLRCRPNFVWLERDNQGPNSPATAITWYDCAMYCNWLSEQDHIPEDQWCYEPVNNDKLKYFEGMKIKPNHLSLTGYRLPTEAEWEYSSRSGSSVSRYYGRGVELLPRYGLFVQTRDESARPVGQMRPNDRGLFDILGNAAEWVEDPPLRYSSNADEAVEDEELLGYSSIDEKSTRTLRGGSSVGSPAFLRSAHRDSAQPGTRNYTFTFRPARTLAGEK